MDGWPGAIAEAANRDDAERPPQLPVDWASAADAWPAAGSMGCAERAEAFDEKAAGDESGSSEALHSAAADPAASAGHRVKLDSGGSGADERMEAFVGRHSDWRRAAIAVSGSEEFGDDLGSHSVACERSPCSLCCSASAYWKMMRIRAD